MSIERKTARFTFEGHEYQLRQLTLREVLAFEKDDAEEADKLLEVIRSGCPELADVEELADANPTFLMRAYQEIWKLTGADVEAEMEKSDASPTKLTSIG